MRRQITVGKKILLEWFDIKKRRGTLFFSCRPWEGGVHGWKPKLLNSSPTHSQLSSNPIISERYFLVQILLLPRLHIPLMWFACSMTDRRRQVARYKLSHQEDSLLDESVWCPNFCRHKKTVGKKKTRASSTQEKEQSTALVGWYTAKNNEDWEKNTYCCKENCLFCG